MRKEWVPQIYTFNGFTRDRILGDAKALDVGCGSRKLAGATGMDIVKTPAVDVVHDVNSAPWPFPDESFDLVFLNHALEHVDDVIATLNEIHRVLSPGGRAVIQVPYFRSIDAFTDPTHRHFFTGNSFEQFIAGDAPVDYNYSERRFKQVGFWYGWPHDSKNPLRQALKSFIHSHRKFYDQYLSLVMPVRCLTWELEKID